jgi:hypothetical protein
VCVCVWGGDLVNEVEGVTRFGADINEQAAREVYSTFIL